MTSTGSALFDLFVNGRSRGYDLRMTGMRLRNLISLLVAFTLAIAAPVPFFAGLVTAEPNAVHALDMSAMPDCTECAAPRGAVAGTCSSLCTSAATAVLPAAPGAEAVLRVAISIFDAQRAGGRSGSLDPRPPTSYSS
jgi:hypothetical protein